MLNFSVCIEMLFNQLPVEERFFEVKKAGLRAAEIWGWSGRDLNAMKQAIRESGVALVGMCVDSKDAGLRERYGSTPLVADGSAKNFYEVAAESVETAKTLGVKKLIVTTGQARGELSRERQHENIISALRSAAPIFEKGNITAVLEPLNVLIDHKGYYLSSSDEAADILRAVGSKNVKMLFDVYHQQITEGNVVNNIIKNIDLIGHFHIADNPGRREPGTGELNYANIFRAIEKTGYDAYVGFEFSPSGSPEESLKTTLNMY